MPDVKISALPASTTPLAGTEVLPIVQSATTKQVSVANLTAGRSVGGTNFIPSGSSVPTNGLYLPAANTLGFSTNSTEQMRITDTGIVGINNNSPTAVNGRPSTLFVGTNNSGSAAELVLGHQGDGFSLFTSGGSGTGTLTFAQATTGLMTLTVAGKLGIGTSSPSDTLSVINSTMTNQIVMGLNTTDTTYGSISFSGSNSGANRIGLTGGGGSDKSLYLDSPTGGAFYFRINAVSRQEISSAGIVTMSAYGAGAATFAANGSISSVSDETWKIKDGIPVNTDVMLQKLEPGYWFYNAEKAPIFGADRQLGFYAQNVREAIGAEAAPTPEEGKPWGYYDRSVLAVVVMSLKNALTTIEELKQRITALENK